MNVRHLLACVTVLLISLATTAPPAQAAEGGVVDGDIDAWRTYQVALCSVACQDKPKSEAGWDMEPPEFYEAKVDDVKTGIFATTDAVDAGEYRVFWKGLLYDSTFGDGYLRAIDGGYDLTSDFEEGTLFTVAEATDVNLGALNLQLKGDPDTDVFPSGRFSSFGPNLMTDLHMKKVQKNAVLAIKTSGCGKVQQVKRVKRAGTYTFEWNDPNASEHYGPKMRMIVSATFADGARRTLLATSFDLEQFGWNC